jgi:predicted O-methyltransferase YrrM
MSVAGQEDRTRWIQSKFAQIHEHDERWNKVGQYNWSHLHGNGSSPDPALLKSVLDDSDKAGLPSIAVDPAHGKFLNIQARSIRARNILEVGTLGGYSTIWLASSHKDVKVTTVEYIADFAELAKKHFEQAGVADRIEVKLGNAMEVIPRLVEEVKEGKRPKIDFAFIDANKESNLDYFNMAVEMARPGALIVVDNVVRRGKVIDPEAIENDTNVKGVRRLIEAVGKDTRVDATILQVVAEKSYDGFLTAIVKGDD